MKKLNPFQEIIQNKHKGSVLASQAVQSISDLIAEKIKVTPEEALEKKIPRLTLLPSYDLVAKKRNLPYTGWVVIWEIFPKLKGTINVLPWTIEPPHNTSTVNLPPKKVIDKVMEEIDGVLSERIINA